MQAAVHAWLFFHLGWAQKILAGFILHLNNLFDHALQDKKYHFRSLATLYEILPMRNSINDKIAADWSETFLRDAVWDQTCIFYLSQNELLFYVHHDSNLVELSFGQYGNESLLQSKRYKFDFPLEKLPKTAAFV